MSNTTLSAQDRYEDLPKEPWSYSSSDKNIWSGEDEDAKCIVGGAWTINENAVESAVIAVNETWLKGFDPSQMENVVFGMEKIQAILLDDDSEVVDENGIKRFSYEAINRILSVTYAALAAARINK